MDFARNARSIFVAFAAAALSGVGLYISQGLQPVWWTAWLAPLPVLLAVPRLCLPLTSVAALGAGIIGGLAMWDYHTRLQFPLWLRVASVLVPALAFWIAVVLFRIFFRRGAVWPAALVFPAFLVGYEYLLSLFNGTFGVTAYTQLTNLPVLQLGALSGLWGISFVVLLFAPMIAAIAHGQRHSRTRLLVAFSLIFGSTIGWGTWRLSATPEAPHTVSVGLVASDLPENRLPDKDEHAMRLLREYADQVQLIAQRGAQIVVLPEMTAVVLESNSRDVDSSFWQTAQAANVRILAGLLHVTPNGTFNEARLYSPSGVAEVVYRKHHLVPVLEGRTTPGTDIAVVPESFGNVALAICRDLDYPNPARLYGKAQAGLLLAPAWDFDIDRAWHGHMAILRGVENGYSIVRAAKDGLLTVSDSRGRILQEKATTADERFTIMLASVPVRHEWTLYQAWGDWFARVNLVLLGGLLLALTLPKAGNPRREHTDYSPRAASVNSI